MNEVDPFKFPLRICIFPTKIPLTELVGNLQTYELGLSRIGKLGKGKSKSMALKAKNSDTDKSSDDEDSKMKSYITR